MPPPEDPVEGSHLGHKSAARPQRVRRSPSHPHAPIRVPDIEPARAACAGAAIEWSE